MAQFPLTDLLTGIRRLFVGVQGKATDGSYKDINVTDNGEVKTVLSASNQVIGRTVLSDGTNSVSLTSNGSVKTLPVNGSGTEIFSTTNPAKVFVTGATTFKGAKQSVSTAGTKVQLPSYACTKVTIVALKDNTGSIFIGGSDVTQSVFGAELEAKDAVTIEVSNTNLIYLTSSVSGEGISYFAV
jgi:hypothetical protein